MRTTQELIAELEEEAKQHWYVAIVVDFEDSVVYVTTNDSDRQIFLDDAVQSGGQPVGLIAADKKGGRLTMLMLKLYPEREDWMSAYLGLFQAIGKGLIRQIKGMKDNA